MPKEYNTNYKGNLQNLISENIMDINLSQVIE